MSEFKFKSTIEPAKLKQIFELSIATEDNFPNAEKIGAFLSKKLVAFILSGRYGRGFYLENKQGEVVAGMVVAHHRAVYKEPSKGPGALQDPVSFGVSNILGLRVSHVYVRKDISKEEVENRLLKKAIESVEDELLKKELAKSSDKPDGFKHMVTTSESKIDPALSNYYMSKKYFWFSYSDPSKVFGKFGFKSSPVEGYSIPSNYLKSETTTLVEKMLSLNRDPSVGKTLKLLDSDLQSDQDMIRMILQEIELETLSQLNKSTFHSELSGGIRSSLSLTNVDFALNSVKLGSFNELTAISESMAATTLNEPTSPTDAAQRRKSSAFLVAVPRFSLLPDFQYLANGYDYQKFVAEENGELNPYTSIQGALLTNELQGKTFYVLWRILKRLHFQIVCMGELKMDMFGSISNIVQFNDPPQRRRGSSFTGINEMGGFNFQDLHLLILTAVFVANKKSQLKDKTVYVLVNDLPMTVPTSLLHDFFCNYMPDKLEGEDANSKDGIEYIEDFKRYNLEPMLRKFGSLSSNFEIDWIRNSMMHW